MIKPDFETLEITRQQELIEQKGKFIQTQEIGNYLCDTYEFGTFYVLFFCLISKPGEPDSRCFDDADNVEHFINSLDRSMS